MKQKLLIIFAFLFIFLYSSASSNAKSSYVLPYPSSMPGSFSYKPHLLLETLSKYWYFGNFGQFTYNLKQSDKYLVEAKTLFEYNQYLLGYNALQKSDLFFNQTLPNLDKARKEGKDISENLKLLKSASEKHIEVLIKIGDEVPSNFTWQPENASASVLNLKSSIENSIKIRKSYL